FQILEDGGIFGAFPVVVVDLGPERRDDVAQDRHGARPFRRRHRIRLLEYPGEDLCQAGAAGEPIEGSGAWQLMGDDELLIQHLMSWLRSVPWGPCPALFQQADASHRDD